jgi:DNA (cytosine-5)-methyltransferase 3A
MKVLSLFDGISCGMVALERAGIPIEKYVAYEIDKYAIQISKKNYPQIEHCGDVTTADFTQYKGFDLVIGGSPCQDLCAIGSREGLKGEKSGLFFEFVRALTEVKPKYFLLENNASMTKENKDKISEILGVEPIMIDSSLVSAQIRKRLYWTNIPCLMQPKNKNIKLADILQHLEEKSQYNITENILKKVPGTRAYKNAWGSLRKLDQKLRCLTASYALASTSFSVIDYENGQYYAPTPIECERAQTLPDNYTEGISKSQRYKCIGNGWTVDVIAHIFKGLVQE